MNCIKETIQNPTPPPPTQSLWSRIGTLVYITEWDKKVSLLKWLDGHTETVYLEVVSVPLSVKEAFTYLLVLFCSPFYIVKSYFEESHPRCVNQSIKYV